MYSFAFGRDDAATITPVYGGAPYSLTAGAGTDNVAQTGAVIDLRDDFGTTRFGSGTAIVTAGATLAAGKTLTVSGRWENSADGVDYEPVGDAVTVLTLTGPTGGGAVTGAGKVGINIYAAERYIRFAYTPNLSSASTDTAVVQVAYVLTSPTVVG